MKNIHVLPTDKPSRLIKSQDNDFVYLNTNAPNWFENNLKTIKQNIYITSDEEIKDGDWFHLDMSDCDLSDEIHQMGTNKWSKTGGINFSQPNAWTVCCKKIILTTDQDLIKDGVQAIDNDFLEWFVKNPSCEEVEVVSAKTIPALQLTGNGHCWWKIIIPKEELDYTALLQPVGTKQETLEEYDIKDNKIMLLEEDLECVNMYLDDLKLPRTDDKGNEYSIVGRIKILQQEQDKKMYSELIDLLEGLRPIYREDSDLYQKYEEKRVEFIEQFKNK
jgi:hypothetical protein